MSREADTDVKGAHVTISGGPQKGGEELPLFQQTLSSEAPSFARHQHKPEFRESYKR